MKKSKLFKILLVIFAAFLVCFTNAYAEGEGEGEETPKTGWTKSADYCYDHPERVLTVHYIVDGKEVNPNDPNAGNWYSISGSKKNPCTIYYIPESYYNYNTGFGSSQKMFTNEDGTLGVIYWYNNPELEGNPVFYLYPDNDPDNNDIYLYAKTGKIIEVYANGYKKKVVVGKTYSPATMEPDYDVEEGVTHDYSGKSVNYWNYSTEADYFSYTTDYAENNSNSTYTYYRDKTYTTGRSTILPAKAQYLHVDNTQLVQFINYESCRGNDNYLYCDIANPDTGEAMTSKEVQEMLNDEYAYNTVYIHDYKRIPKYYKYFGFIDTEGREYPQDFVMQEEYAGRAFTTVVDGRMSCATNSISPYSSSSYVAKVYNTTINFQGAEYSGDFNTNYLTKLKTYYGNEYYPDNKTNYYYSTCVPYDVNYKYTYTFSNPNIRRYTVVIEGTEGVKVNQNSVYKLPSQGKPKSSDVKVVTLKYQDGETPDERLTYTRTYTPSGFKIDGVHYDFGQEIVVTRDLYITYDYTSEVTGPDLPTPERELFNFKGWYDATIGGHIITDPKELQASVLYAQWGSVDKVTIVRPDGIPIELEKGSSYTMPNISDKDEVVNSSVSFNYNDRSGRTDVSKVITYYKKNGIKDKLTGEIYAEGETIIANHNMVLTENYIVTRVPATFPKTPTRNNYEFVGWFDAVEGGNEYTEYSGDQDLSLFARWEGDIEQVTIYFPDGFYVTIDKGESYTLPRIDSINDKYKVTFKYQDDVTADKEQYVIHSYLSNGWIIDGDRYAAGEVITPMEDVYLIEDFVETYSYPTFEEVADREWYTFEGWYDAAEGGNKVTSYEELEPATFYAQWEEIPSKDIVLEEVPAKTGGIVASVTFYPNNGDSTVVSYVSKTYEPNGWIVDGVHYNVGDTVTITRTSTITPDYVESTSEASFPDRPSKSGYTFQGWFNKESGGNRYTSYRGTSDLTLYGHWAPEGEPPVFLCRRAKTLHEDYSYPYDTYGSLGTDGSLQTGDAFDCDVNGDGYYDSYDERFYYLSDYYDTHTKTFNPTYATLVHSENDEYQQYARSVSYNGPTEVTQGQYSSKLPKTTEWTNVTLYQTERAILNADGTNSNTGGTYPDNFSYTGYAARMITAQEISSGCNITIKNNGGITGSISSKCDFLQENMFSDWETRDLRWWLENPTASTNYKALLYDGYGVVTDDVSVSSMEFDDSGRRNDLKVAIDVPKEAMEIDFSPLYYTLTFPDYTEKVVEGSSFVVPANNYEREDEEVTIIYKYQDGVTPDKEVIIPKHFQTWGWTGSYYEGETITVNSDITFTPDYHTSIDDFERAKPVNREGYEFEGWFTQAQGGAKYRIDLYDNTKTNINQIVLYAHWHQIDDTVPVEGLLCRRAETLHFQLCQTSQYCQYYMTNGGLTFGRLGESGLLSDGDAFDCDVNGDGVYDADNERFYYVSDYYDTATKTFDPDWAVLIYYNNYGPNGADATQATKYTTASTAINGPEQAITYLPTTDEWPNVTLKETTRRIWGESGYGDVVAGYPYNNPTTFYPTEFSYEGKAARLLTSRELYAAMAQDYFQQYSKYQSFINSNRVRMENSQYMNSSYAYGYWLENPVPYVSNKSAVFVTNDRATDAQISLNKGVRPAIDVPKSKIEIQYLDAYNIYVDGVKMGSKRPGETYTTPSVDPKEGEAIATVTLVYQDGATENQVIDLSKEYLANGYTFNNNHYDARADIVVNSDLYLVSDYVEVYTPADLPTPTKQFVNFVGWFDAAEGGNQYSISDIDSDITLYAHWDAPVGPTVLPTNDTPKEGGTYTVTFDPQNEGPQTTSTVTISYTPNGWLVDGEHYDDGAEVTLTENSVVIEDYIVTSTPAVFPDNPTKENAIFSGWYDAPVGGNKYTSYEEPADITLYANYYSAPVGPDQNNILCIKASSLHSEPCAQRTGKTDTCTGLGWSTNQNVVFGQRPTDGELKPGDAFDCDVNGDGVFNSTNERFYYVTDYYDTYTGEFDTSYATLIYYNDTENGVSSIGYNSNYSDEDANYKGPKVAYLHLPSTSQWSNVTLKDTTRQMRGEYGSLHNQLINYSNIPYETFEYTDRAARLLTLQEVMRACEIDEARTSTNYDNLNQKCLFLYENTAFTTNNSGNGYTRTWLETPTNGYNQYFDNTANAIWSLNNGGRQVQIGSPSGTSRGIRPAIDVPKDRIDITISNTHSVTLPDRVDTVDHGAEYTIPDNKYPKASETVATITLKYQDTVTPNSTLDVIQSYTPNGFTIGETHYNERSLITVNEDITLVPSYVETITPVTLPTPTNTGYTFAGWYDQPGGTGTRYTTYSVAEDIILYAYWTLTPPTDGEEYTLPANTEKDNGPVSTVTFVYNDGSTANTTSFVTASFEPNGWLVDGVHYNVGDVINYEEGMEIVQDYIPSVTNPAVFPNNPVRNGYTFIGWFDTNSSAGGQRYTTYSGTKDLTLYARWLDNSGGILPQSDIKCKRATTLHTAYCPDNVQWCNDSGNAGEYITFGNISDSTELVTGDALDCDVNGDGTFDDETERFYYVSDYYDTNTMSFNGLYASLIWYDDYPYSTDTHQIRYIHWDDDFTSSYIGPTGPINATLNGNRLLPLSTDWTNVSLYTNERAILPALENISNPTIVDYSGLSGRLLNYKEVEQACGINVTSNQIYELPENCSFLWENAIQDRYYEMASGPYWLENPGDSTNAIAMETGYIKFFGTKYEDYEERNSRPVIDVAKVNIEGLEVSNIHTVTYPDGSTERVLHGGTFIFPENTSTKNTENVATVTFNYMDTSSTVEERYVTKSFVANGWKVNNTHYDNGASFIVNSDITLEYDYVSTIHGAEFVDDPIDYHNAFMGWFDSVSDGTKYTSYDGEEDLILWAHWEDAETLLSGYTCRRASTLHTGKCIDRQYAECSEMGVENNTKLEFGNIGISGELHTGDAFDCDVNGDGTFDSKKERFYYVSDYYNTETGEFEDDTAALIWYTVIPFKDGVSDIPSITFTSVAYDVDSSSELGINRYGPRHSYLALPSTTEWSNVSLKNTQRQIRASYEDTLSSKKLSNGTSLSKFTYTGRAARYLTIEEAAAACDVTQIISTYDFARIPYLQHFPLKCSYLREGTRVGNGGGLVNGFWLESVKYNSTYNAWYSDGSAIYDREASFTSMSVKPVIDMPKDKLEIVHIPMASVYIDGTKVTTFIAGNEYTIPQVPNKTSVKFATVQFEQQNGNGRITKQINTTYIPVGFTVGDETYQPGQVITVDEDLYLVSNYTEGIEYPTFPDDPEKPGYTFVGWFDTTDPGGGNEYKVPEDFATVTKNQTLRIYARYDDGTVTETNTITYPDGRVDVVKHNSYYTMPRTTHTAYSEKVGTAVFKYYNGHPDTESDVIKTYTPDGWRINGHKYNAGNSLYVSSDLVVNYNYAETYHTDFPTPDPTYEGQTFYGWSDMDYGGSFRTESTVYGDIVLYAVYYANLPNYGDTFIVPPNTIRTPKQYVVHFDPQNGDPVTTSYVYIEQIPDGWLAAGRHVYPGDEIIWQGGGLTEVYNNGEVTPAEFPSTPTKAGYEFTGWYDQPAGGNRYTTYSRDRNITLYAHWYDPNGGGTTEEPLCTVADYIDDESESYATIGEAGTLVPGNAYDCVINTNGDTGRFYYVSDYYDTHTKEFDDTYQTFIYSGNYYFGEELNITDNTYVETNYASNAYNGPTSQLNHLPSKNDWNNISLYQSQRQILTPAGETTLGGYNLPNFDYGDSPSRLLTVQEVNRACNITISSTSYTDLPYSCRFLSMNLDNLSIEGAEGYGYYLENPTTTSEAGFIFMTNTYNSRNNYSEQVLARPAIDVPKSRIEGFTSSVTTYTVTYPNGYKETVEPGTVIIIPENNQVNNNIEGATVTFKLGNGQSDIVKHVTNSAIGSGYKIDGVHYNSNSLYTVNSDITLEYDYVVTAVGAAEFPADPVRNDYTFAGWFADDLDGSRYFNYSGYDDITLYAHWDDNMPSYICKRATELHTITCDSTNSYCNDHDVDSITYGQLGIDGVLTAGDAFDCDVNGDGIYDPDTERFYYVSDYYDTYNDDFNTHYGVLIYSNNTISGVPSTGGANYNTDGLNIESINTSNFPTSSQWSNVSLYDTYRIVPSINNSDREIDYENAVARYLRLEEVERACGTHSNQEGYLDNCLFLLEDTNYKQDEQDEQNHVIWDRDDYTSVYLENSYLGDDGNVYTLNSYTRNVALKYSSYYGVIKPTIELPKEEIEISVPNVYSVYIDNTKVKDVVDGKNYILPNNESVNSENIATITFKYNDGITSDVTRTVTKSYEGNGYTLGDEHYNAGDVIVVNEDKYLTSNYIETVSSPTFPANPTRTGYEFVGWITTENYEPWNIYPIVSSYDGSENITLYAQWRPSQGAGDCYIQYMDTGEIEIYTCNETLTVPNKVAYESETLTFNYLNTNNENTSFDATYNSYQSVVKYTDQNNREYTPGETITVNGKVYLRRTYSDISYDDTLFTTPNDAYRFIGWFTLENGGTQVNNYTEYKESGSTTSNVYGHYNEEGKCTVVLDGEEVGTYDCGSSYTLPAGSNVDEDIATVTFIDGESTTTSKVHATKTFSNYSVKVGLNGTATTNNASENVTVSDNTYITSNYTNVTITPVTISNLADKDYYSFEGWYTRANGEGVKVTGSYSNAVDITLYSYYVAKKAQYSFYDAINESNIGYMEATYGTRIDTSSIRANESGISEHEIRYVYNNGTNDFVDRSFAISNEIVSWTQETTNKPYALIHTVDVVGPISLNAVFGDGKVATNITLETLSADTYPGYDFAGWYTLPVGGKLVSASDIREDKDYTFYAHWTRNNTNICTLNDGTTMECPEGESLVVPAYSESIVGRVNEIINGTSDQYKDEMLESYEVVKTSYIDYAEVDGVKYYPGDTYTIGVNPEITIVYKSSVTTPVTLDTNIDVDSDWFNEDDDMIFVGWFTERTGGTQLFKYDGEETINVYARYKVYDPDEETYTLYIEGLDGNVISQENISKGTKIKLFKDQYLNNAQSIELYDSDETTLISTVNISFIHEANKYLVNGSLQDVGSYITIYGDTYAKAYETNVTKNVAGYKEPSDSTFTGYFTAANGGTKVDVNNITEDDNIVSALYAHYVEETPNGYVRVDFDGEITNVPQGSYITLPLNKTKDSTSFNVRFNFNRTNIEPYVATITTEYTLDSYLVNNRVYNPGTSVQANSDLVIRSHYSESKDWDDDTKNILNATYPDFPTFDVLDEVPTSWVIDLTNGTTIDDASTLNKSTELYAHYTQFANVYLNDEIIAQVKKGTTYTLPINNLPKNSDIIGTVTFVYNNGSDDTTSNVYKYYSASGWYIGESEYVSGAKVTVNEDITLVPRYKETVVKAVFPKTPVKEHSTFNGWFTSLDENGEQLTEYSSEGNIALYGKWTDKVKIVDPTTGETEYVDPGTVITLESLDDKEEKFYNITFDYNYEGAPSNKVVRISTQEVFKGWLINGVLHQAGEEITVDEDITKSASYEKVINNKNLPNDPTRTGYTFTGWYTSTSELFGSLVDITKIESTTTVYAHWENFDPETQVKLTWDGVTSVHDKGEVISLEKEGTTQTSTIANVTFVMNKEGYSDKIVKITNTTFVDHLIINGNDHAANGTYTLNADTVITSVYDEETNYPALPVISSDEFEGFYTAPTNGEIVTTLQGVAEDVTYYARWGEPGGGTVPAIIDGEEIEIDNPYTVPTMYGDEESITVYLDLNYDEAPAPTAMTITSQKKVLSQNINGITYYPGDVVVLPKNSVITTNLSNEYETTTSPEYQKPSDITYDGSTYTFNYWTDEDGNVVALSNLTGMDSAYDGSTLYANYQYKYDDYLILHVIDGSYEEYVQIEPDSYVYLPNYANQANSSSIYLYVDDYVLGGYADIIISQDYELKETILNGKKVNNYYSFYIDEDTTVKFTYSLSDVSREIDYESKDFSYLLEKPPVQVDEYNIYTGLNTNSDGSGETVDILTLTPSDDTYDGISLYVMYDEGGSVNTTLTIDGEVSIVPVGNITLPDAKTKASDTFKITYDYNDGTSNKYTQTVSRSYEFAHYKLNDENASQTEYAAGSTFNITKPSEFNSVFNITYNYPTMHTLTTEGFLGWYTDKTGGTKVTNLNNITEETTLYARWDDTVYYTVPEVAGEVGSIQIYFDYNYEGAPAPIPVTVTSQKEVLYQTINGVVHYPGELIKRDGELDIRTVYSDDIRTTFSPDIPEPEDRDEYFFTEWMILDDLEWDDGDTIDNHLISFFFYDINGFNEKYDGKTLYAYWTYHYYSDPEERVKLKIDFPGYYFYYEEYGRGDSLSYDYFTSDPFSSWIYLDLYDEDDNYYYLNYATPMLLDKIIHDGKTVDLHDSFIAEEDGTISYYYDIDPDEETIIDGSYPDYLLEEPPYEHDGKTYVGVFDSTDEDAKQIDIINLKGTDVQYSNKTYFIRNIDGIEEYTYLYLDDNPAVQIPLGDWTLPAATTKDSKDFFVTFDYNDGSGRTAKQAITQNYTFDHFHINGTDEDLPAQSPYNVTTAIRMNSVFTSSYSYPTILVNTNKVFDGWYTERNGGTKVTTLQGITEATTLYAHYNGDPNGSAMTFDGQVYVVPDDVDRINPLNDGYAANQIIKKAVLTLVLGENNSETHTFNTVIDHIGWTDENGVEYGEIIDLADENIGSTFTSRYSYDNVEDIDLSRYNPDDNTFKGWFTQAEDGEKVTIYSPVEDETYYAQYYDEPQVIITVDGEVELYPVGSTYTLPDAKTKTGPSIVITFDHQDGNDTTTTKSFDTIYTFSGYRLEADQTLYGANYSFDDIQNDMTFTSTFAKSQTTPTWPDDPTKEHYFFLGWFTAPDSGLQVFNYDDISTNTTLYAQYVKNADDFVTITNSATGESIRVLTGSDFVYSETKFYKVDEEKLGKVTFKFNSPGYPDEEVEFKIKHTPSGFYVGDDTENLIGVNTAYQFNADTTITPYYDEANDVYDGTIGTSIFDYDITKDDAEATCFSKTNQTDPRDNTAYTCYTEYDKNDGDITLYLHWAPVKAINVTKPDGTVEVHNIYDTIDLGVNDIDGEDDITYTVNLIYHDGETQDGTVTYSKIYSNNGWLITTENGENHYDDNASYELIEDVVIKPDYTVTETTATLPTPTRDDYTFMGWNKLENGLGKYYKDSDINGAKSSGELTLHAVWSHEQTVTISFDSQGGTPVNDYVRVYGEAIGELPETQRDNFIFRGWYTDTTFTTEVTPQTIAKYDSTYYALWTEDITPGPGQISVTYPDGYVDIISIGSAVWLPDESYYVDKPDLKVATITFKYQDEETDDAYAYVYKTYTQSGWKVTGDESGTTIYEPDRDIYPEENIYIQYNYIETTIADDFPDDPTRDDYNFDGWFDIDGTEYTSYLGEDDLTLYANWSLAGPTDISVESNALILVKGEEKQIEVITTPANLENVEYTYTVAEGGNEIVTVSDDGLITAIGAGTTTVEIAVKNNPSVTTTISVTVYNNRITSQTLDVENRDLTGEDIRIIIGAEPETMVEDFLTNIDNELEFIEVYNKDDELISPDDYADVLITTGAKLKLVINGTTHDEVIVIIRGDISQDGYVDVRDQVSQQKHILGSELITGYQVYAADLFEDNEATIDDVIDVRDNALLDKYILGKTISLNEKEGD
ncbi:MAG: InlB B-repeat-containing protein [Bacilli bacterium]|nr:InlB B-repeat-containing protein [Bacilli bacterium]